MAGRRRRSIVTLVIAACLTMGATGIADAVTVGVRGVFNGSRFVWTPKVRPIARGTAVRWRAVNGSHNVRSRGANWSYFRSLRAGAVVSRTFNRRGTFRYFCTIHGRVANGICSGMCGSIVVS